MGRGSTTQKYDVIARKLLAQRGEASPYASWFDIDWNSSVPGLAGKVLVPFLDRSYAEALAGGQLQLQRHEAAVVVHGGVFEPVDSER